MSAELKPCPFCGAPAKVSNDRPMPDPGDDAICCTGKDCSASAYYIDRRDWNRRARELDALGPQGAEAVACWRVTFAGSGPPRIWQDGSPDATTIAHCERYGHRIEYAYTRPPVESAPVEPDPALLVSMATCLNHGFGLLAAATQRQTLADMRKLWDEMNGRGYYSPANRERYTAMLNGSDDDAR